MSGNQSKPNLLHKGQDQFSQRSDKMRSITVLRTFSWLVLISGLALVRNSVSGHKKPPNSPAFKQGEKCASCGQRKRRRYFYKKSLLSGARCTECGGNLQRYSPSKDDLARLQVARWEGGMWQVDGAVSVSSDDEPEKKKTRRSGKRVRKSTRRKSPRFSEPVVVDLEKEDHEKEQSADEQSESSDQENNESGRQPEEPFSKNNKQQDQKGKGGRCTVCGKNRKGHGKPCVVENKTSKVERPIEPKLVQFDEEPLPSCSVEMKNLGDEIDMVGPPRPDAQESFDLENEEDFSDWEALPTPGISKDMDHDNTLEFEDLPTDEQNELTAAYKKNVHIHETQATKREYAKEKMPCNECGSLQLPNNMPRHKKTKLCQRARKDKLANKLDQKPQSTDIEQVISVFFITNTNCF